MKPAYAKFGVSAHLHLVPVTQPFHLHLVHPANLHSQAQAVVSQAVVHHPSQAQAPVLLHFRLALHLVLRLALSHHLAAVALSHHRVLVSPAHAAALRLAIRPLAQAAPVLLSQALLVALLVLAALHLVSLHLALVLHPVIQPSHLPVPLAAHLVALHLHLQARASRYYKASISIHQAMMRAILLLLLDLVLMLLVEWITAYLDLDDLVKVGRMILMVSKAVMMLSLDLNSQIQFSREKQ